MSIKLKGWVLFFLLVAAQFAWAKTIKFATEASYYPFVSLSAAGNVEGFETDIIKALCQQMDASCTFSHQPWESLIISVQTGKFDAIYGGLEITPARMQRVVFSEPIYDNLPGLITLKDAQGPFTVDFLRNKNIGVQIGTTYEQYILGLNQKDKRIKQPKSYNNIQLALLDFSRGRLDLVLADYPILLQWQRGNSNHAMYQLIKLPDSERQYFGAGYGIAVNLKNTDLLEQINTAIDVIKEDGTYDKIYQRYFDADDVSSSK